jgi:trimethylamine--corrinoid protein Co-methyltransferase
MHARKLTAEQVRRINDASFQILQTTGVVVPHPDMLNRFADAGADVDHAAQRVRIPRNVVEGLVAKAGKKYTLYGRDESKTASFGTGHRNYNSIAGEASWVDKPGGKRRFCTLEDVATSTRFADALEHITIPGAMSDPSELPTSWRCVEVAATMIRNTTKPITFWFYDRKSAKYLIDLAIAVRGSVAEATAKPLFYPFLEPISPLRFPFDGIDLLYETARLNLPVPIGPMAQMGLSAPATVAGTLAQQNAEVLAGVCVTQLVREGMPVCYGGICHAFDMGTTQMIFAGPEQAIFGTAMTQLGKSFGLPVYINVGLTDSKIPDAQAGLESGVTLMLGAAAGADIFGHMGISGVDQATSLDMLALQDEVISYVESVMREVDFSDEALGLDIVESVGPGGSYVGELHTAMHFRQELWQPGMLDRQYYQAWLDNGAASTQQRCRERVEHVLASHQPEPVSPELDSEISRVVAEAKRGLG